MLSFLPEKLNLDGTFQEIISLLYSVFEKDIKMAPTKYKELPVIFDDRKIDSKYEEGFWHIISRGKENRKLDFKRAKRLPWIKPIIENSKDPGLLKWLEHDFDKKGKPVIKTYIWYREGRYLIILKEIPKKFFLITAFYVSGKRNDDYYYKKYQKAKKKGPEC